VWRSTFAFDVHSTNENPQFLSNTPTVAGQLAVLASSPLLDAGQTLNAVSKTGLTGQSVWPSSVDLTPQDNAWSIGAFISNQ